MPEGVLAERSGMGDDDSMCRGANYIPESGKRGCPLARPESSPKAPPHTVRIPCPYDICPAAALISLSLTGRGAFHGSEAFYGRKAFRREKVLTDLCPKCVMEMWNGQRCFSGKKASLSFFDSTSHPHPLFKAFNSPILSIPASIP